MNNVNANRAAVRSSMPPRVRMLSVLVGGALALMAAERVWADSAVGGDTTLGNALNLAPINPVTHTGGHDFDGMNGDPHAARTPTGQLYDRPRVPTDRIHATDGGWQYLGFVEFGLTHVSGDHREQGFKRYKDVGNGGYLSAFGVSAEKAGSAHYLEVVGGGAGRDDQFYGATFGRYNDWRVKAFYNETPHVFTTSFRSLWDGAGGKNLTLKPDSGLTPGGSGDQAADNQAITAAAQANMNTELGLVRKKGGLRLDMTLTDKLKLFAGYSLEKREGSRPFGSVWAGGGGQMPMELIEPIDYETHDFVGGLYYNDTLNSFNLQASASLFRNNAGTLNFETPFRVNAANTVAGATPGMFTSGRFDLYPDNEAYNIKGEYARKLPELMNGRFTAVVSMGSSRQDDKLMPYTSYSGLSPNISSSANWDSRDALSRQSADARIDTRLIDLGLSLNPTNRLNLKAKARYYETRNHTDYLACNPNAEYDDRGDGTPGGVSAFGCTGVWGRLINDGSASSMYNPAAPSGNVVIRSVPYDYRKLNTGLSADWRLDKASINAAYERETYSRDHRERDKTWEDKYKLGYVNRSIEDTTIRLSFAHDRRRGSSYHTHHPYANFLSGALAPMPETGNVQSWVLHMNNGMRKYDLADRTQNTLNARLNYMPREDLDIGLSAQLKEIRYPSSDYGRDGKHRQNWFNVDVDWQYSPVSNFYAFYSFQRGTLGQTGVPSGGGSGCIIGANTSMGVITPENAEDICQNPNSGAVFVAANFWELDHKDRSDTLGLGLRHDFGRFKVDFSYTYAKGRTEMKYSLPANLAPAAAAAAGSGFPNLSTSQNIFEANLLMPVNKTVTARLLLRHEYGKYRDWHYSGLQSDPVAVNAPGTGAPTAVILDAGPQNYRASLIGLLLQVRL
ncbi:MtrB/PioB family outer membrane beta-barrel protein [Thauera butanivorans]|uniref:MtrB/PioB family outer membrane beta-barrel protein n=1 Tax=Thauera butanivorans TaxID=86174 RepID=UPI0008386FB0|nr:MtrB/PioB family outer membrane beta-barrel protein [Thauera butanivorans]